MTTFKQIRGAMLSLTIAMTCMVTLVACAGSAPEAVEEVVEATVEATTQATIETVVPTVETIATAEATEEATAEVTEETTAEATGEQATLVVQLDQSRTLVRKVDFTAPISGLALLEQSGLDMATVDMEWGTAVCSIEGVGCPVDDCFCNENIFWSYLTWQGDTWVGYPVGPSQSVITTTGATEGWQWGTGATPPASPTYAEAAHNALTWLGSQQVITDGSYAGSASASVESLLALGANHIDAAEWRPTADAPSLLDFVLEQGAEYAAGGIAESAKLAVSLSAVDACWPADALKPSDYYSPTLGALHSDAGPLAWAILGTLALDEAVPTDSVEYLAGLALPDGGWEWSPGWGRDTNSTAVALQALIAAGTPVTDSVVASGQAYLLSAQSEEGGFGYDPNAAWGNVADANSTAYVLQALAALGVDAASDEVSAAYDYLLGLQNEEGALGWQVGLPDANMGATQQAIPALLGQPYPIQRVALPNCE